MPSSVSGHEERVERIARMMLAGLERTFDVENPWNGRARVRWPGPPETSGLDPAGRLAWARKTAEHYLGDGAGSIELMPQMPAVLEMQVRYGLTPAGAYDALRRYDAPKQGQRFAPLSAELRHRMDADRRVRSVRRKLADQRQAATGCSREAAERWARRTHTFTHKGMGTGGFRGTPADSD